MNWLRKLFGKSAATPAAAPAKPPTQVAAKPTEDVTALRQALANAADAAAQAQLADRLGRALAIQAQVPRAEDAPEIWIAAVCQLTDKALALDWVARIKDEACLSEVATKARGAEIRYAAAQRITTTARLEHVAQAARNKDKRVYQHCSEQLRQRRHAEASSHRAQQITDQLQGLLAAPPLPSTALLELKKELASLADAGETGATCEGLMQQALDQLRRESEALRDLQAAAKAAETLAAATEHATWPWDEHLADWRHRYDALRQTHANLPAWLVVHTAARGLSVAMGVIESSLNRLVADDERGRTCDRFLADLEACTPTEAGAYESWSALAKPDHPAALAALHSRWTVLMQSRPQLAPVEAAQPVEPAESVTASESTADDTVKFPPPPRPRSPVRIDQEAVLAQLDVLEQAIAGGHLAAADAAAKQIKSMLGSSKPQAAIESRLHSLQAQLETMRGWARWGTQQAREKLTAAAQELLVGEPEVEQLATAISALREEWKRLNAHAAASKAEWESFDATLEQAYQPVAAYRAEQAERQAEARAAREALCANWETELAAVDWAQTHFKVLEALRAEWIQQWRAAPQTGFRDERVLRKRFDTLIGSINQQLDAARANEFERREQLIAAAQALAAQPDLRQAMAEAKSLQQRWNPPEGSARLKRGDEQKQWTQFRAACNAVFERLDAQRAEQSAQRQAHAESRQNLLDAFALSLNGADRADSAHIGAIKQALAQFRADWDAARPTSRDAADTLEIRARELQQQAQQFLDSVRHEKYRARFELLARKAALAERIEVASLAGEPLDTLLTEVKQAWDALPPLTGKSENLLINRLEAASRITPETLDAGQQTRAAKLLDLEIALGLPSPENYAEVRRERQLERLQNRFDANPQSTLVPEEEVFRWYSISARPDKALAQRMDAIVSKIVEQAATA